MSFPAVAEALEAVGRRADIDLKWHLFLSADGSKLVAILPQKSSVFLIYGTICNPEEEK